MRVFPKTVGIPIGTNCAPLLADLFLYSYEADFIQRLLKKNEKKLARSFNFTFRYIDDVHKSARRGAQFVPIGMPTVFGKTRPPTITNMLSMKNSKLNLYCYRFLPLLNMNQVPEKLYLDR
jgi:hypothetical protein